MSDTEMMLREALELAKHVRRMTRAENVHARAIARADAAGTDNMETSRDDVDMIHADLYAAWPAKRLDTLIAALASSPGGELSPRVRRLVMAARVVAFEEDFGETAIRELDAASEAFAADLPWANEPKAMKKARETTPDKPCPAGYCFRGVLADCRPVCALKSQPSDLGEGR